MRYLFLLGALILSGCPSAVTMRHPDKIYTTTFQGTENPLSEGGVWTRPRSQTAMQKANGRAFGTMTGRDADEPGGPHDSLALLSGFGPDVISRGTVSRASTIDVDVASHEVEFFMRGFVRFDGVHGYEFAINLGYGYIVRWDGRNYHILTDQRGITVRDGDQFEASCIGSLLTLSQNGVVIVSATDTTYPTGQPGIGAFFNIVHPGPTHVGEFAWASVAISNAGMTVDPHGPKGTK